MLVEQGAQGAGGKMRRSGKYDFQSDILQGFTPTLFQLGAQPCLFEL